MLLSLALGCQLGPCPCPWCSRSASSRAPTSSCRSGLRELRVGVFGEDTISLKPLDLRDTESFSCGETAGSEFNSFSLPEFMNFSQGFGPFSWHTKSCGFFLWATQEVSQVTISSCHLSHALKTRIDRLRKGECQPEMGGSRLFDFLHSSR